jgi:hypothetical protein
MTLVLVVMPAGSGRPSVLDCGDRAVLGEHPLVPTRQLARVQRDRRDLALAGANLDPPPDQARIQRVIIGIEADVRTERHPDHSPAIQIRLASGNGRITRRLPLQTHDSAPVL